MENPYKEFRCPHCHKLLFKGLLDKDEDKVEIKCRGCGGICTFCGGSCIVKENAGKGAGIAGSQVVLYLFGLSLTVLYLLNELVLS